MNEMRPTRAKAHKNNISAIASRYDREGRFFHEDLDVLKGLGYLTLAVPVELGGP